jgi:branched-chain amino acid transport system substrate-binding protein
MHGEGRGGTDRHAGKGDFMSGNRNRGKGWNLASMIAAAIPIAIAGWATDAMAEEPIRIGSSIPITGTAAFFGQHSRWGAQLAVDEANASGGVLGRQIETDFQDNRCNPTEAVKSVSRMLSDKKDVAILDGLCSSAILAIMPLVERSAPHRKFHGLPDPYAS